MRRAQTDERIAFGIMDIHIELFNGVVELDWAGPWEVLASWSRLQPDDGITVRTVARSSEPITCAKGLRVLPDFSWEQAPRPDVLVYPGGVGARRELKDAHTLDRVRTLAASGTLMTSVCSGALVYAAAGLLEQRAATTHWGAVDELAALSDTIEIRADDRFVDSGQVITSAGVSAGIDMALHLVARLHSHERARQVRRHMQYEPAPPV